MESHELYNGEVILDFDPVKHYYYANGKYVPGVTTALKVINKPALIPWAVNKAVKLYEESIQPGRTYDEVELQTVARKAKIAHRDYTDNAADMGTFVHDWIENFVRGNSPQMPTNKQLIKAINAFMKFWDANTIEPIYIERPVYSRKHGFAGKPDLICRFNGKLTVLDWKTGSGIYPEYVLQCGAYALAYTEEIGEKVQQVGIVNCSVKAPFSFFISKKVKQAQSTYIQAYELGNTIKTFEKDIKDGN